MIAPAEQLRRIISVDDLLTRSLRAQQELSAVELYARRHARQEAPAQARYYRDLLPATPPGSGQQYAFEVDLDRCTACKACVVACHNLNGLEEKETWRRAGLLIGGSAEAPFQQTVTGACHHCVEPACMHGCPVLAYEKHPVTGIVKHLDDQCIGCKYCTLTCPYDVPQYSRAKGIVRKCDMCTDRLAAGEAPACVQACPNQAIRIRTVEVDTMRARTQAEEFLPGAAVPAYTRPTTTYTSRNPLPDNLQPADLPGHHAEEAHLPLVAMLVLTQLSVGTFLWDYLQTLFTGGTGPALGRSIYSLAALVFGLSALGASTLHLGRPQYAFRAFLGWRRSWLSREIIAFGLFAGCATLYCMSVYAGILRTWLPAPAGGLLAAPALRNGAFGLTVLFGLLGVFCSIMVYAVTQRPLWRLPVTSFKFMSTTLLLGMALVLCGALWAGRAEGSGAVRAFMNGHGRVLCMLLVLLVVAKSGGEAAFIRRHAQQPHTPQGRAVRLMTGRLKGATGLRRLAVVSGGVVVPVLLGLGAGVLSAGALSLLATIGLLLLLAGEWLERYLFFTTSVSARMPGSMGS